MSWKSEIEARRRLAFAHGGEEAVAKQHELDRLTIRERIDALLDAESFGEQGPIAGYSETDEQGKLEHFTPANYVLGMGRVDGRPVVVGGEDFTQRGGSPSPAGLRKSVFAEEMAVQYRVPLVRFLQGGGGSVAGTSGKGAQVTAGTPVNTPHRFLSVAQAMATVPCVSAGLGAVAGLPAARLVASHFSLMTKDTAQILVAGPAVVERALGESLSKEELGGASVHAKTGVVDNVVADEAQAMEQIRAFLSYLPTNVWESAPRASCEDDPARRDETLLSVVPRSRRQVYDPRKLVKRVLDADSFFELGGGYGRSQITGLARLAGQPVGVWVNDPRFYAGSMSLRRPVRHVPSPGRRLRGRARLHDRKSGRARRHHPLRHRGDVRGGPEHGALGVGDRAQDLRSGGGGPLRAECARALVALGRRRRAAPRGRHRCGVPPRDRGGRRPGGQAPRARGALRRRPQSLPARGVVRRQRHDRPTRDAPRALQVDRVDPAQARAAPRPSELPDPPLEAPAAGVPRRHGTVADP
jgi:acetyl-CoA carboxylase beta subunit